MVGISDNEEDQKNSDRYYICACSEDEAMTLLMDVSQDYEVIKTQWSIVYDLDNFKLYYVSDMDTSNVYEISRETFE